MSQPEYNPEAVMDMVVQELGRRMADNADAIPAHVLSKIFDGAQKQLERREEKQRLAQERVVKKTILDIVRSSDLGPEGKREIIETEIRRLQDMIEELRGELDE